MTKKPIVFYQDLGFFLVEGQPTVVKPTNHYSDLVSNTKPVVTSVITNITDDGFETLNTRYIKMKDETCLTSSDCSSGSSSL